MRNAELSVKLMSRTNKIILSVIGGLIAIVAFSCLYGFSIGGKNALTAIFLIVSSLIISALIFAFIFGKDFIKSDKLKNIALGVAIGICVLSYFTYNGLNRISADESKTVEYEAKITYYIEGKVDSIDFVNSHGDEVRIDHYDDIIIYGEDEPITLSEAEFICIKEIQGGFGYPIYEVLGFK